MQGGGAEGQGVALLPEHADHFSRETGEGGQRPQKAGDQGQAPDRVQIGQALKDRDADPHQVAADQVGSQRAQRDNGAGIEPEAEALAQQGAEAGTDANGDDRDHGAAIINATAAAYILLGSQVAICGKNQSSSTITHIRKKKGRVTRAM